MQHFDVVAVCIDHSAANDDAPPVPVEAVVDPFLLLSLTHAFPFCYCNTCWILESKRHSFCRCSCFNC